MSKPFVIYQIADNFDFAAAGIKPPSRGDQSNTIIVVGNGKTAEQNNYTPGGPFDSWVTDIAPNAPNATEEEAYNLVNSEGPSGQAYRPVFVPGDFAS